jgi:CheY-like chemotaxis protein
MSLPRITGTNVAKKIRTLDDAVPIALLRTPSEPEPSPADCEVIRCRAVLLKEPREAFVASLSAAVNGLGATAAKKSGVKGAGVRATVLTIDDDPAARSMVKLIFEGHGFRVLQAASGEEGLKALEHERPQVILLDLTMPGMDGLMTLKKIKALASDIPVIMVSARGEQETVRDAMSMGAYDYVTKPFSIDYIESTVLTKLLIGIEGDAT